MQHPRSFVIVAIAMPEARYPIPVERFPGYWPSSALNLLPSKDERESRIGPIVTKPIPKSVIEDYLNGTPMNRIAEKIGSYSAAIRKFLFRNGIEIRRKGCRSNISQANSCSDKCQHQKVRISGLDKVHCELCGVALRMNEGMDWEAVK